MVYFIAVTNVTTKQSEKLLLKHMLILNMKVSHIIVINVVSIQRGKQFFVDTKINHEGICYSCYSCSFISQDKATLKSHVEFEHEGLCYRCDLCDYILKKKNILKNI